MSSARTPLLVLAALVCGSAPGARAQTRAGASTVVQASVVEGLTVLRVQDLDFGTVIAGSGLNPPLQLTGPGIGKLHIVGRQNRWINVTLTPPDSLWNGTYAIDYVCGAAYNESADQPGGPGTVVFDCATAARFRMLEPTLWRNYGRAYLYLYGAVNLGTDPMLAPGVYTASFTVTAAY